MKQESKNKSESNHDNSELTPTPEEYKGHRSLRWINTNAYTIGGLLLGLYGDLTRATGGAWSTANLYTDIQKHQNGEFNMFLTYGIAPVVGLAFGLLIDYSRRHPEF